MVNVSVVVTWAGLVGKVKCICFFTCFGTPAPSTGWGLSSSRLSSEEYSITTFLSSLPPGLGSDFGLPFPLHLPIASGFPQVVFRVICLVRAMQGDPISRLYDIRSVSGQRVPLFLYRRINHVTN